MGAADLSVSDAGDSPGHSVQDGASPELELGRGFRSWGSGVRPVVLVTTNTHAGNTTPVEVPGLQYARR